MENNNIKLSELEHYFFDLNTTEKFVGYLKGVSKVFAPHKKGHKSYSYREVESPADVVLDYPRTIQPLKKYFLPPREVLLSYNTNTNEYDKEPIPIEERIFFGIHPYEMQGIFRLDYSFEKSIFIGVSFDPDEWHFSKSVGIDCDRTEGFSLYFRKVENGHLVYVMDEAGKNLLSGFEKSHKLVSGNGTVIEDPEFSTKSLFLRE